MVLKLTLKPGERVAINGAVIVNGDRRASLMVENHARVLRESDIMQPAEATSPARLIYLAIMMMYLEPDSQNEKHSEYETRLREFLAAISDADALQVCATLAAHIANKDYYKGLIQCRQLIEFEEQRLSHVA